MQDARCLKVKPRERAFKQFKIPVLSVLKAFGIHEVSGFNRVIIILSDCPKHQIRL